MKCIRSNVRFDGYRLNQNTRSWSPGYQLRSNEITNLTLVAFAWSRALHSNLQGLNLYIQGALYECLRLHFDPKKKDLAI